MQRRVVRGLCFTVQEDVCSVSSFYFSVTGEAGTAAGCSSSSGGSSSSSSSSDICSSNSSNNCCCGGGGEGRGGSAGRALAARPRRRRRRPAPPRLVALLLPLLLLLLLLAPARRADAQGLKAPTETSLGAQRNYASLATMLARASKFRNLFKDNRQTACSSDSDSLCGGAASLDDQGTLYLAASAQNFDARTKNLVSPVRDQGTCNTCTSNALVSAAEGAVSAARQDDAEQKKWSVQDFHFCASAAPGEERSCSTPLAVVEAVKALVAGGGRILLDRCLPYIAATGGPNVDQCKESCDDVDPDVYRGKFTYTKLGSPWEVQRHIRLWGAVITRLDVYDDLKPFYKQNPYGIYRGPTKASAEKPFTPHAVVLVGYNNDERYWLYKNSWGTKFAMGGFARISFDAVGTNILEPDATYGVMFNPRRPVVYKLCPHPTRRGCYMTKPPRGTWPSQLADDMDLSIRDLLVDNLNVIKELDRPLGDAHVVLCNLSDEQLRAMTLEDSCPAPPPKCTEGVPPQPVRTVHLRGRQRVGDKVEMRVAWGLPPGKECVREYRVTVVNLRTNKVTRQSIPLANSNAAGSMRFQTRPIGPRDKPASYLFDIVAVNAAGMSVSRSLTVQA